MRESTGDVEALLPVPVVCSPSRDEKSLLRMDILYIAWRIRDLEPMSAIVTRSEVVVVFRFLLLPVSHASK